MFDYRNLLSGGVALLFAARSSPAQASDGLVGTEWAGQYDLGPVTFRFLDGNKVSMTDSSGRVTGTYERKDDSVTITAAQSDLRLVCQGKVQGQTMSGTATTNRGARLTFQLTQVNTPAGASPDPNPATQRDTPQRTDSMAKAAQIGANPKDVGHPPGLRRATPTSSLPKNSFAFIWAHPAYWRQKLPSL
jgi:hypothetical protein